MTKQRLNTLGYTTQQTSDYSLQLGCYKMMFYSQAQSFGTCFDIWVSRSFLVIAQFVTKSLIKTQSRLGSGPPPRLRHPPRPPQTTLSMACQ